MDKSANEYVMATLYAISTIVLLSILFGLFSNTTIKENLPKIAHGTPGDNSTIRMENSPILEVKSSKLELNSNYNPLAYVIAKDYEGNDITEDVIVYGTVNTAEKGVYNVTYTVVANEINCRKEATFIVD